VEVNPNSKQMMAAVLNFLNERMFMMIEFDYSWFLLMDQMACLNLVYVLRAEQFCCFFQLLC